MTSNQESRQERLKQEAISTLYHTGYITPILVELIELIGAYQRDHEGGGGPTDKWFKRVFTAATEEALFDTLKIFGRLSQLQAIEVMNEDLKET